MYVCKWIRWIKWIKWNESKKIWVVGQIFYNNQLFNIKYKDLTKFKILIFKSVTLLLKSSAQQIEVIVIKTLHFLFRNPNIPVAVQISE